MIEIHYISLYIFSFSQGAILDDTHIITFRRDGLVPGILYPGLRNFTLKIGGNKYQINLPFVCEIINKDITSPAPFLDSLCNCSGVNEYELSLTGTTFASQYFDYIFELFECGLTHVNGFIATEVMSLAMWLRIDPNYLVDLGDQCTRIKEKNNKPIEGSGFEHYFIREQSSELLFMEQAIIAQKSQIKDLMVKAMKGEEAVRLSAYIKKLEAGLATLGQKLAGFTSNLEDPHLQKLIGTSGSDAIKDHINAQYRKITTLESEMVQLKTDSEALTTANIGLTESLEQKNALLMPKVYEVPELEKSLDDRTKFKLLSTPNKIRPISKEQKTVVQFTVTEAPLSEIALLSAITFRQNGPRIERVTSVKLIEMGAETNSKGFTVVTLEKNRIIILDPTPLKLNVNYELQIEYLYITTSRYDMQLHKVEAQSTLNGIKIEPVSKTQPETVVSGMYFSTKQI